MSKFCSNCGTALEDDVMFCGVCGTKSDDAPVPVESQQPAPVEYQQSQQSAPVYQQPQQPEYQQPQQPLYQQPQQPLYQQPQQPAYQQPQYQQPVNDMTKKRKSKKGLVIGLILALLAAAAACLYFFVFKADEKPYSNALDQYLTAQYMYECDDIEALMPEEVWDALEDYEGQSPANYEEYFESNHDDYVEELEYEFGENIKFSYEVANEEKVKGEDLDSIKYNLELDYGINSEDVKDVRCLEVDMTMKGSDDSDEKSIELYAIKIGSKWYIGESDYWEEGIYVSFLFC